MAAINEAYHVLGDPARRVAYDAALRGRASTSPAGGRRARRRRSRVVRPSGASRRAAARPLPVEAGHRHVRARCDDRARRRGPVRAGRGTAARQPARPGVVRGHRGQRRRPRGPLRRHRRPRRRALVARTIDARPARRATATGRVAAWPASPRYRDDLVDPPPPPPPPSGRQPPPGLRPPPPPSTSPTALAGVPSAAGGRPGPSRRPGWPPPRWCAGSSASCCSSSPSRPSSPSSSASSPPTGRATTRRRATGAVGQSAGWILGLLGVPAFVVFIVVTAATGGSRRRGHLGVQLEVGDCVDISELRRGRGAAAASVRRAPRRRGVPRRRDDRGGRDYPGRAAIDAEVDSDLHRIDASRTTSGRDVRSRSTSTTPCTRRRTAGSWGTGSTSA